MCAEFIRQYTEAGWVCHPETFDFDIVLVSPEGQRVGIEAKLQPNIEVLYQALTRRNASVHFRGVLVPYAGEAFCTVAHQIKLSVSILRSPETRLFWGRVGYNYANLTAEHMRWQQHVTQELPERPVMLPAGVPSPRKVTRWNVAAVGFCLAQMARHNRGFTAKEFKAEAKLDMKLWVQKQWVVQCGFRTERGRRVTLWQLNDGAPDRPDRKYPEIADALRPATVTQVEA